MNQHENADLMYTSNINNKSNVGNYLKIDSENFLDEYRMLKQQQKDFLLKINMSAKLKREIFGFTDLKQHRKPDENQKLVTLLDPFKGRLIMKEKVWLEIAKQRQEERINLEKLAQRRQQQQEIDKAKKQEQRQKSTKKQNESEQKNEEQQQKSKEKKNHNFFTSILKKFSKQKDYKQTQKDKSTQKLKQKRKREESPQEKVQIQIKQRKESPSPNNELSNNQYNIKIQGQSRITPTPVVQRKDRKVEHTKKPDPPMNILEAMMKQGKPAAEKSPKNDQRMRTTMKFLPKQEDEYSNISEIHKVGSPKDFSSSSSSAKNSAISSMGSMLQSRHKLDHQSHIKK